MKNKIVIYTAVFGGKDELLRPAVIPAGCDFVCFTDEESAQHPSFKKNSDVWDVRIVSRSHEDGVRNARKYKVLGHNYLGGYDISIWIDGNIIVRGDVKEWISTYLADANIAVFDHNQLLWDPWDCIYTEAQKLIELAEKGRRKDDPVVIQKQVARYREEGYPEHNGLLVSMIMYRRHNAPDVRRAMEEWWAEIERGSRRDQLSFNYVAWKQHLKFNWLPGDSRDNPYFKHVYHLEHRPSFRRRLGFLKDKVINFLNND